MDRNHCQFNSRRILLVTCLFLTGCAEQSIPKLETAFDALEDARQSGAEDYAIEIFHEAESTYFQAQEELDQQQERLEPFRDYEPATAMLASVLSSAAQAKLEAIANKEEAKANAHVALVSARRNLHTIRTWLTEFTVPETDHVALKKLRMAGCIRVHVDRLTNYYEIEPKGLSRYFEVQARLAKQLTEGLVRSGEQHAVVRGDLEDAA